MTRLVDQYRRVDFVRRLVHLGLPIVRLTYAPNEKQKFRLKSASYFINGGFWTDLFAL